MRSWRTRCACTTAKTSSLQRRMSKAPKWFLQARWRGKGARQTPILQHRAMMGTVGGGKQVVRVRQGLAGER